MSKKDEHDSLFMHLLIIGVGIPVMFTQWMLDPDRGSGVLKFFIMILLFFIFMVITKGGNHYAPTIDYVSYDRY